MHINNTLRLLILLLGLCLVANYAVAEQAHYAAGSVISDQVLVQDRNQTPHSLSRLLKGLDKPVNVVYLFGGGGMGHQRAQGTGGIWCPDSFEDLNILKSLAKDYNDRIGIIPVAIPPVFHTGQLGFSDRVMLDIVEGSENYQSAVTAFIDTTQAAFLGGTIPIQPYYDTQFNLLISEAEKVSRKSPKQQEWHGSFRAADETQSYGVPNLWLVDENSRVLSKPFRGNIYHPHGQATRINYSLQDVIEAIETALKNSSH